MTTLDLRHHERGTTGLPTTVGFSWSCVVDSANERREGRLIAVVEEMQGNRPMLRLELDVEGSICCIMDGAPVEIEAAALEDALHIRVLRESESVLTFVLDRCSPLRLLYLHSTLPAFAGLRGGTYDPPQFAHEMTPVRPDSR